MNDKINKLAQALCTGRQVTVTTFGEDIYRGWIKSLVAEDAFVVVTVSKHQGASVFTMREPFIKEVVVHD